MSGWQKIKSAITTWSEFLQKHGVVCVLVGIIFLSAALALSSWLLHPTISRDGTFFLEAARQWYQAGSIQGPIKFFECFYHPPLFIYGLVLLQKCHIPLELGAVIFNILLCALLPWLTYRIARIINAPQIVALGAALLTAVAPSVIELGMSPQRDILYLFLMGNLIYQLLCGFKFNHWYNWGAMGLILGLAILVRFESAEFIPLIFLVWGCKLFRDLKKWKQHIVHLLLLVVVFCGTFYVLNQIMDTQDYVFERCFQKYQEKFQRFKNYRK